MVTWFVIIRFMQDGVTIQNGGREKGKQIEVRKRKW